MSDNGRERRDRVRTVCDFASQLNILLGVDDDLLLTIDGDDLGGTVWIAGMVDETAAKDMS